MYWHVTSYIQDQMCLGSSYPRSLSASLQGSVSKILNEDHSDWELFKQLRNISIIDHPNR